jgi:hypothetical protein
MFRAKFAALFIIASIAVLSSKIAAEQHTVGDFTVHYSLINTSFLEPEVATQYGLKRSKNIAMLNISVLKKSDAEMGTPVICNVFGNGRSLSGQFKELAFREIKEDKAIYYIATFAIGNGERLSFDLQIQPEKQGKLIPIKFKQQVYTD